MSYSARDYDTLLPPNAPTIEIVPSASGELDFVPNCPDGLANCAKEKGHALSSPNTKMATLTEYASSTSLSSHSSSISSLSSATSVSSAHCNDTGDESFGTTEASTHNAVLLPLQTVSIIEEDLGGMPDEVSSISASRRVKAEGKGKTPDRIQQITISHVASGSKSANMGINKRKSSLPGNQTSVSIQIEEPTTYHLESSPTSYDSEDDDCLAELSASLATIRPPRETPESSTSSVIDDTSESVSLVTSPHSDQGYTWEVRPPSSIMASHYDEEQDTDDDPPTVITPQPFSPTLSSALHTSGLSSRRPSIGRVAPPPELPPVPPVASIRSRRSRPLQDGPRSSTGSSDRRRSEHPRAYQPFSWYRPRSSQNQTLEDTVLPRMERSSYTRSPSLSPLAWDTTPVVQGPTSSFSFPTSAASAPLEGYLTGSWPAEISDALNMTVPSPSNPLLSNFRPIYTPNAREDDSHAHSQPGRTQFLSAEAGTMSFSDLPASVPVPGLSNSPSMPHRAARSTIPLPPSPGSSFRTSAFNSPFPLVASSVDSWGTPATMPGEAIYNRPNSAPGETAQWPDLQQPQLATNPTTTWLPETNTNAHNPSWTGVDWPAWSDPIQIPQVNPIATATPSHPYVAPPGYLLICSFCRSPAATCVCRRYVRMAPVPTGATSTRSRTPMRPPSAHPTFWFSDGTVVFEVEDIHFKVHRYFFEHHSENFRRLLARRSAASANVGLVRIPDAKRVDFERLLKVFYPSSPANPDLTTAEEWTSVLTLAVRWHMENLVSLAIQELTPITSAVDKISLAKKFGLFGYNLVPNSDYNRDWLLPALMELCGRNFPLRFEDARKLDMWTVVKVWEVQHEISNTGLSHNAAQIRLIKRKFGLE